MNFDHFANVSKDLASRTVANSHEYYNPHSDHFLGKTAYDMLEESKRIMQTLFPMYKTIEFIPSGGSLANVRALLENDKIKNIAVPEINDVIMMSSIEHSSISKKIMFQLNSKGYVIVIIPITKDGIVDIAKFEELFKKYALRTIIVSCMSVNNEIGTIQPINEIVRLVKSYNNDTIVHSDSSCNLPLILTLDSSNLPDIITCSCYKFGGPHLGILFSNVKLKQDMYGTPDVENSYFSALACQRYVLSYNSHMEELSHFKSELKSILYSELVANSIEFIDADSIHCVGNVLSFVIIGLKTSLIQQKLNDMKIAIGSGSACTTDAGSHTILAMGYNKDISQQLVRLSFDYVDTSIIHTFVDSFVSCVNSLKFIKKDTGIKTNIIQSVTIMSSSRKAPELNTIPHFDIHGIGKSMINTIILSSADQSLKGGNKDRFDSIMRHTIEELLKKKLIK